MLTSVWNNIPATSSYMPDFGMPSMATNYMNYWGNTTSLTTSDVRPNNRTGHVVIPVVEKRLDMEAIRALKPRHDKTFNASNTSDKRRSRRYSHSPNARHRDDDYVVKPKNVVDYDPFDSSEADDPVTAKEVQYYKNIYDHM